MKDETIANIVPTLNTTTGIRKKMVVKRPLLVLGVGNGGAETVNALREEYKGTPKHTDGSLSFVAADTDEPRLRLHRKTGIKTILLPVPGQKGQGTGRDIKLGRKAAVAARESFENLIAKIKGPAEQNNGGVLIVAALGGGSTGGVGYITKMFLQAGLRVWVSLIMPRQTANGNIDRLKNAAAVQQELWYGLGREVSIIRIHSQLMSEEDSNEKPGVWFKTIRRKSINNILMCFIEMFQNVANVVSGDSSDMDRVAIGNQDHIVSYYPIDGSEAIDIDSVVKKLSCPELQDPKVLPKATEMFLWFQDANLSMKAVQSIEDGLLAIAKQADCKPAIHETPLKEINKPPVGFIGLFAGAPKPPNPAKQTQLTTTSKNTTSSQGNGKAKHIPVEIEPVLVPSNTVMVSSPMKDQEYVTINVPEEIRTAWEKLRGGTEMLRSIEGEHQIEADRLRKACQKYCDKQYGPNKYWVILNAKFRKVIEPVPENYFVTPKPNINTAQANA